MAVTEASQQQERWVAFWRPGIATSKTWMFCARVRAWMPWPS